ncbi:molybdopterin-dependent oxidoreductase [Agromyces silvae]|uniref:molybdopterin-dependent oxidoreductase n=1 Tax=Agromyces silvae TaxID=3388266 RepID=UPI00280B2ECD|nr:molybdopterin-dependent oxidoreductase [Agromyces protaetiae]
MTGSGRGEVRDDRRSRGRPGPGLLAALAGLAAAVFAAGIGELAAALVAPESGPFVVVGGALVDLAPAWAKDAAIALFGTADKLALLIGIGLVLALLSAGAGLLEVRWPPWGRVVFAALGVAGALAAGTRAGSGPLAVVPSAAAGLAGAVAVMLLARRVAALAGRTASLAAAPESAPVQADPAARRDAAPGEPTERASGPVAPSPIDAPASGRPRVDPATVGGPTDASGGTPLERRRFLVWAGGAAAVGVLAALVGSVAQTGRRAVQAVREAVRLPAATASATVPPGAELDVDGLTPLITPNADFYRIDTALRVPEIDPAEWSLRIHGLVERELTITWDELLALPMAESITTLTCVSNEVGGDLIGTAVWLGHPIRELLAQAGPNADADMVLSRSLDGFTASTPIEALEDDRNAILAVGMNGEPLPLEHGFPVRMVVPGLYGYVSATKWVTELEVTRFDEASAYWTDRGWSERGPIKLSSRIDVPRQGQPLTAGPVVVAGVAWQPHTGVAAVEVQVDDGPWLEAELSRPISADTWVQWRYDWDATSGSHRLRVRATGGDGELQSAEERPVVPDGATGLHERTVSVG